MRCVLELHGGIVFEGGVSGFGELGGFVVDEFLDGGGVGAAFALGG